MEYLKLKNWENYQHYKNRNPPWVKLYYEILLSRQWMSLDDTGKALMIVCILLASRDEGKIPCDIEYIKKFGSFRGKPDLQALVDLEFLEHASTDASIDASTSASALMISLEEKRREEKSREDKDPSGVRTVIEHFKKHAPKTRGGKTLEAPIRARLREGYEPSELCTVIDKAQGDSWHKKTGKCLDLPYLMNEKQVVRFLSEGKPSAWAPEGDHAI